MQNVVIAGSGPAGLTAAIYLARAGHSPLVLEGISPGGQLVVSHEVENYPGFPEPISGAELMMQFKEQAERFGARFRLESVTGVQRKDDGFSIATDSEPITSRALVIATGAVARRLPIPSEAKFYGRGVSGCATCDGAFFRDKEVLVVGGGNTAMEDATFLTRFASRVTIVHRREYLRATAVEVEKAKKNPKIGWLIPRVVEEILGDETVTGARLSNPETGETEEVSCDGVFVAIGHDPQTTVFRELVETDDQGFIKTVGGSSATSTPGVFACGDVHDPVYKQAVLAAGHGCMAALDVQHYLEDLEAGSWARRTG
jgi:thioredoxin reductase (NADPH)